MEIFRYVTESGTDVVGQWLAGLGDVQARTLADVEQPLVQPVGRAGGPTAAVVERVDVGDAHGSAEGEASA